LLALLVAGAALAAEKSFDVALASGKVPAERRTLRVAKGDRVVLRWTSDRAIALHLHGYDVEAAIAAKGATTMRFTAGIAGRFPVSEHRHGAARERTVLYLEVLP